MKVIFTSKEINNFNYIELGVDDGHPVLYAYRDGELFDWHFSEGSSFEAEMVNTINCYKIIHGLEPSIKTISEFRSWFKALKDNKYIN